MNKNLSSKLSVSCFQCHFDLKVTPVTFGDWLENVKLSGAVIMQSLKIRI